MTERHRPPGNVMTPAQVAEYLQLHKLTIYKYVREGRLPAVRLGRSLRIMKSDVERFLEERKQFQAPPRSVASRRREAAPAREPRAAQPAAGALVKHSDEIYVGPSREDSGRSRDVVVNVNPVDWVIRGLH